jgi:hypothetical protein
MSRYFLTIRLEKRGAAIKNDGSDYDRAIGPDVVQFDISNVRVYKRKRVQNHSF